MTDEPRPFIHHLEDLRRRIIVVLLIILAFFMVSMYFVDDVLGFLGRMTGGFVFLSPTEALFSRLKIALLCGILTAIPLVLFEIWKFVGIALKPGEKKFVLILVPLSYVLFLGGAAVAWFAVIPYAVRFLLRFQSPYLTPAISIDKFIGFSAWLTIAFGSLFQLPLVVLALVQTGVLSPATLSRYRPHVVLGLAIASAFLTPGPDFVSQLALLIPSYLLFEGSLLAARLLKRKE